jgi:flagellar hook-length control protein FliK
MQTGLPSLDLSIFGASAKGQKASPEAAKPTGDVKADQLAGFMEIMSALLTLPPEKWQQSLAGLDGTSADGSASAFPCLAGNSGQHLPPADLLKLMMNVKGEILQELQSAKAEGRQHPLLDMAEALMEEPQVDAQASEAAGNARLPKGAEPETPIMPAEPQARDWLAAYSGADQEEQLFPGLNQKTGKDKIPLDIEATIDDENKSITVGDEQTPKTSRHPKQADDFLFKTVDAKTEGAQNPDPAKKMTPLAAEAANAPVESDLPDEKIQIADKMHQPPSDDGLKDAGVNARLQTDEKNFQESLVQRLDPPAGEPQELQHRPQGGQESKVIALSGDKEMVPQEKTAPSEVIRQIVQRMSMHTIGDQSKMVIRLKPEFLGNVHMQVLTENQQVTVRMMAESSRVKEIIEQNLPHLRAELHHHGLEIQKFDVFVANDEQSWRGGQEQAGFSDTRNRKQSQQDGGKSRRTRRKIGLNSGDGKRVVQKEPGEVDYFA